MELTNKQKADIKALFWRTELRDGEVIIDNTDLTISNELGIQVSTISHYLQRHLTKKYVK